MLNDVCFDLNTEGYFDYCHQEKKLNKKRENILFAVVEGTIAH